MDFGILIFNQFSSKTYKEEIGKRKTPAVFILINFNCDQKILVNKRNNSESAATI